MVSTSRLLSVALSSQDGRVSIDIGAGRPRITFDPSQGVELQSESALRPRPTVCVGRRSSEASGSEDE